MQRIYLPQKLGTTLTLHDADLHHQLTRVLRVQASDQVIFFAGEKLDVVYEVVTIDKKSIEFRQVQRIEKSADFSGEITLYQALPNKLEKVEYILQKGVEVGIGQFVFFPSERSQPLPLLAKKQGRLLEIAKEALEQCGGDVLPEIEFISGLSAVQMSTGEVGYVADTSSAPAFAKVHATNQGNSRFGIFVGPEGGWSPKELTQLHDIGVHSVSFGKRILRTETAGVCAAFFIVQSCQPQ